ncbi:aminoacyl-histidine dipeptidase [Sanyastnella coralliicola]|uniref:aminoacyl-histidine dipeptidase n=1 Tax=Sanyastnella coralliicola TaxID=3069118 RepID=UPI0027BAB7E1|nr:aminoacyl-histidine dipeptidase [Longitalea sp. SCSIO 12813]
MSQEVRSLEPKSMWNHFADLNAVPRPSKKEERVIQFMVDFGNKLGLPTEVDEVGNVLIRKPATAGMENRTPLVMQSHLDMVHQKNNDTNFDFDAEGIKMFVEDDWVKAEGTTLGADNGIGVASIMAILASDDIEHPAIDALFTIDEETGMTGALELKGGWLKGKILLNLDTEDDDELTIGCAGGVDITANGSYTEEDTPANHVAFKITVKGLSGGHSGMDINKGLGNANKLMNRVLWKSLENYGVRVASIDGGGLRNAIPRESVAVVTVPTSQDEKFAAYVKEMEGILSAEHGTTDPDLHITMESVDLPGKVMQEEFQTALTNAIYTTWNGIYRMSPDIEDLVQTSNNLARVVVKDGEVTVMCLTRSSLDTEKDDLANALTANFEQIDLTVLASGAYPGWQPRPSSDIVSLMADLYREMFKEEPNVLACHAGLECGILGTNYPDMDMVSFGPNIRGAHSPDEKVQISSVQKYWGFLLETLKRIPQN